MRTTSSKKYGGFWTADIYREESAKDYVKVCEDGENVIAIGVSNVLYQSGGSQIVKESKRSRRKKMTELEIKEQMCEVGRRVI
mgnify:CR=1 FL=1